MRIFKSKLDIGYLAGIVCLTVLIPGLLKEQDEIMLTFIIRKLLGVIPMLVLISFLIFIGIDLTPGDAITFMVSPEELAKLDPDGIAKLRERLGLDQPLIIRYFKWFTNLVQGDFGYSLASGVPIAKILKLRLPATLELAFSSLVLATIFGNILGIISALRRGKIVDNTLTFIGMSIPSFFFGILVITIFALKLEWLPAYGRLMPGYETLFDRLPHFILPVLVTSFGMTIVGMRFARSSLLDTLNKDYVKTARSKGLSPVRVYFVHAFRVALTPVMVLLGFRLPLLVGGSFVIETLFQWPGIGTEFVQAVQGQNIPLVMMIALCTVTAVLLSSIIVDVFTAVLDPRVRLE